METVFIILLIAALLLFFLSFFLKDPYKQLREEVDQLSMQQLQEIYQIKKKLKILEEELLISEVELSPPLSMDLSYSSEKKAIHDIIKNQVWSLAQQGTPIKQIAEQSSLTIGEVQTIITEFSLKDETKQKFVKK
jgi:hypothetical protein